MNELTVRDLEDLADALQQAGPEELADLRQRFVGVGRPELVHALKDKVAGDGGGSTRKSWRDSLPAARARIRELGYLVEE